MKTLTKAHRDAIALGMLGHRMLKETKEKIGIKLKGRHHTKEAIEKLKELIVRKKESAKLFEEHLKECTYCGSVYYREHRKVSNSNYYRNCPICEKEIK